MKVISYSFFSMNKNFNHVRSWDQHKKLSNRYWVNIPSLIIVNNILYPNYKIKFHITPCIEKNKLFFILEELKKEKQFNFEIEKCNFSYSDRQPSVWRMLPVWDKKNEIVHVRDIDSLPNFSEYKACLYFEQSNCSFMTMRSHCGGHAPSSKAVKMLAGLSGFKPNKINFLPEKFEKYYKDSFTFGEWGLDQGILIHYFLEKNHQEYLKNNFMDCAINCQTKNSNWACVPVNENILNSYNLPITEIQQNILNLISPLTEWAGKPIDSRPILKKLINISGDFGKNINNILNKNKILKEFYNV